MIEKKWYTIGNTTFLIEGIVAVQTWHYVISSNIPRGVRIKYNDITVDTEELSSSEHVLIELNMLKEYLKIMH